MDEQNRVLVAGAGPVGVTVAYALLRQDIPVTLIEASGELPSAPRAATFHPPTMEMLDRIGLAQPLHDMGMEIKTWQYRDRKKGKIAEFDLGLLSDITPYPYRLHCEQFKYARMILEKTCAFSDCHYRNNTVVTGFTQNGNGVSLLVEGPDGPETIKGRYLIGCDGGRSVVRRQMNTGFEGFTFEERFLVLATTYNFEPDGFAGTCYIADPKEWCSMFRVPADGPPGWWRVVFPIKPGQTEEKIFSDEFVQSRVQGFHPRSEPYEIVHRNLYTVHQRIADTYREGRVFLAGDAAHINNPLGGMGLNFGIHDAINLTEKLGKVWRGEAEDDVFDLYVRQRRTVAVEYLHAQTLQNKKDLEETDEAVREETQAQWRRTAEDPELAREFLLRTAMIEGVRRAESIE